MLEHVHNIQQKVNKTVQIVRIESKYPIIEPVILIPVTGSEEYKKQKYWILIQSIYTLKYGR